MGNCCCHIPESREDDYISMSHDEQEQEQERASLIKHAHSPQPRFIEVVNPMPVEEEVICSPPTPYLTASDLSSKLPSSETNSEASSVYNSCDESETYYSLPNSYRDVPAGMMEGNKVYTIEEPDYEQTVQADEDPLENIEIPDPTPEPAFLPSPVLETRGKKKKKKSPSHE